MTQDPDATPGGARMAKNRAEPVTLEDHLNRGYAARFMLDGSDSEDRGQVTGRLRASGIPRAALVAKRDQLRAVESRCQVSLVQRELLDEALEGMPG